MKVILKYCRLIGKTMERYNVCLQHYTDYRSSRLLFEGGFRIQNFKNKQNKKGEFSAMKAQNFILLLIALIIFPGMTYSQDSDHTFKNGRTNLENTLQTDGYGLSGSNNYLGGLGTQNDYVSIPHDPELGQAADGSIEAWIYITDLSTLNYIISKGSQQGTSAYSFYINTDGRPAVRFGNINLISNGPPVTMNTWTHVAVTWTDPGDILVKFYIDGIQAGTDITTPGSVLSNSSEVRIGVAEFGNEGFGGYIDEVRLWGEKIPCKKSARIGLWDLVKKPACNFDGTNFEGSANYSGLVASWTFNSGLSTWTWEYIGGHYGTRQGNASIQAGLFGNPMPYNNALLFPSGGTDNAVELRDTSAFIPAINPKGTMEVWMRVNQVLTANPVALISKGTTTETSSFYLGLTGSTENLYSEWEAQQ